MNPNRDIAFGIEVCERIIADAVASPKARPGPKSIASPGPGAAKRLQYVLNCKAPRLIAKLAAAPVPGSERLREGLGNAVRAADRLLWRLGFPQYSSDAPPPWPPWSEAMLAVKDHGSLARAVDVEDRLRHLVEEIFWLRDESTAFQNHLYGEMGTGGAPNYLAVRSSITHEFVLEMLTLFEEIFERRPASSTSYTKEHGRRVSGPTIRFVNAVLQAIRDQLENNHGSTLARDKALNPAQDTLDNWIRHAPRKGG